MTHTSTIILTVHSNQLESLATGRKDADFEIIFYSKIQVFQLKKVTSKRKKPESRESFRQISVCLWVFQPIIRDVIDGFFGSYCEYFVFVKITYVLYWLFVKLTWCAFIFYSFGWYIDSFTYRKIIFQLSLFYRILLLP